MRVLMVEDSPAWAAMIREILTSLGHEVIDRVAFDQGMAIELFTATEPDLVTMDGRLMDGDRGLQVAATIRKLNPTVPIIMVSGDDCPFEGRLVRKASLGNETLFAAIAEATTQKST